MTLFLSVFTSPLPRFHQRNLQPSSPSISQPSLVISLRIYPNHGSRGNSPWPCGDPDGRMSLLCAAQQGRVSPLLRSLSLSSSFPFISGCLLAACCLLVAAGGKLAVVHSWIFVHHGSNNGRRILHAPLAICLRDVAPFPTWTLFSFAWVVFLS